MKDTAVIGVVNFNAKYGEKQQNLTDIITYCREASENGCDMAVFPEMALTGYDYEQEKAPEERMQYILAETVPGPSSEILSALAQELGMYIICGLPERDMGDDSVIYNSAVVCAPDGDVFTHRKTHMTYPESKWAAKGNAPCVFDTPFGKVGLAICYEVYRYPEFIRYARAMGARLFINCTAASRSAEPPECMTASLEASAIVNHIYIASANLAGVDLYTDFFGGSSIIGPAGGDTPEIRYHAGVPFNDETSRVTGLYSARLDLTEVANNMTMYTKSPDYGETDFDPFLFAGMYEELTGLELYRRAKK